MYDSNTITFPDSELAWFRRVINFRMLSSYREEFRAEKTRELNSDEASALLNAKDLSDIPPPDLSAEEAPYARLVAKYGLNACERFTLLLALMPHVLPSLLDSFHSERMPSCHGGVKTGTQFLPTGETALYVLAENNIGLRFDLVSMFDEEHVFRKANLLSLSDVQRNEPELSGVLVPSRELVDLVTRGAVRPPDYGSNFPAKRITTEMSWDDLVLAPVTKRQVEEVKIWIRQRERLHTELGMSKRVKPGYKILFYGSPGTGKTLTACLLGQYTKRHVFRIDLSMIVSKYIGETEKNLAKVFDKAEHADWILFFDEADALFGSRTKVSNSHDRYANQEVSYLLQRIEDYDGIVILASNMKGNIDDAFMRRFSSVVHFPFPKSDERLQLWQKALPQKLSLSKDVDMKKLADRYEMTGANITNIIAWCALIALEKGNMMVTDAMLRDGMARELAKEGRTL